MGWWLVVQVVLAVGLFVLSELLRPKPELENARPAGLGDFRFPTATEGRVVPLVWGTVRQEGPNVVWYGDLKQTAITEKVKTGLFSSETITKGFEYRVGIQFALSRGAVTELREVWIGDTSVFSGSVTHDTTFTINEPELFGGSDLGNGGVVGTLRFFEGNETQTASTYLSTQRVSSATVAAGGSGYAVDEILTVSGGTFTQAALFRVKAVGGGNDVTDVELINPGRYTVAPANPVSTTSSGSGINCTLTLTFGDSFQSEQGDTPAYRGTCYIAPDTEPVYIGNSTSIKPWKFEIRRLPNGLGLTGGQEAINSGNDANPANVIYELLTDTDWGLGIPASQIDTANFSTAGATFATEGNGFSFLLDRPISAVDLLEQIERQIDGYVVFNHAAEKYQINLARGGYDPDAQPEMTNSNVLRVEEFARGSWEDTTNQVRVEFNDRADDYKQTYALAQDMANFQIQGVNVSTTERYPGVKDRTLANQLAWRDLRTVSYPLARGKFVVDRSFYDVLPGDIVTLSKTIGNTTFSKLPMRVTNIDLGTLDRGEIRLEATQDIFVFRAGSFGDPILTGWTPPADALLPFIISEQKVIEAPRAFTVRDPLDSAPGAKIWAGARRRGNEVTFEVRQRNHPTTPSGAFTTVAESFGFMLIGELKSTLSAGSAIPLSSLLIETDPDSQSALETAFTDATDPSALGLSLGNLILVDDEFMIVQTAQTSGADVQLNNVYRGVLDSTQADHVAGTRVFLVFNGGTITDDTLPETNVVDVKLIPKSTTDEVIEASAETFQVQMARRYRRPYPPSTIRIEGTLFASTVSLEAAGSGPEDFSFGIAIRRRDYRTVNEVDVLDVDAATTFADFPSNNSTTHTTEVFDTSGTPTSLYSNAAFGGTTDTILRIDVLKNNGGVLPTDLRLDVKATHTDDGDSLDSLNPLQFEFAVTSALTGQFEFGALDNGDISNVYTADAAGTHSFTLSSAFTAGDVEYRLNGGAFTTLIAAGGTGPGTIAGVAVSDTIEIRHLSTDTAACKQIDMTAPGAGTDAFGILFT